MNIIEQDQTIDLYRYITEELKCVNEYLDKQNQLTLTDKLNLAIQAVSIRYKDEIIDNLMDIKELVE